MKIEPHDYQQHGIDSIFSEFESKRKVLYQLSTGGGKTFVFSFLTKKYVSDTKKKVLILCHREELINQTIESMNAIGVTCEAVTANTKKMHHSSDCYVGMIETVNKRLQKNPYMFKDLGIVIADECHILIFDKVFDYFKDCKILGCTATPVINKRVKFWRCRVCKSESDHQTICCADETTEWSRPFTMSRLYESIVLGPKISELIDRGVLVREISFKKEYTDSSGLEIGSDGDFSSDSIDEAYNGSEAVFNVLLNYEQYCLGKKTMIFNGTSKQNLILYQKFKEAGYENVRMYDSVNKSESGSRSDLLKWFRSTQDAILLNVGVFTTGFDDKTVQGIILNRPTMSLSLFMQIAGRGARSTYEIYKDHFIFIDGGGNIDRFQEFSDPTRDWERIFWEGIGREKVKKEDAMDVQICDDCGAMHSRYDSCCPNCGYVQPVEIKKPKVLVDSDELMSPIREIPPPNGEKIYQYTKLKGEDINFAFKILVNQIVDMFKLYRVTKNTYITTLKNGKLERRIRVMINKCYFPLIAKQDIAADNNRTIQYLVNKLLAKLKLFYDKI